MAVVLKKNAEVLSRARSAEQRYTTSFALRVLGFVKKTDIPMGDARWLATRHDRRRESRTPCASPTS